MEDEEYFFPEENNKNIKKIKGEEFNEKCRCPELS
jgi:hypothetical protein